MDNIVQDKELHCSGALTSFPLYVVIVVATQPKSEAQNHCGGRIWTQIWPSMQECVSYAANLLDLPDSIAELKVASMALPTHWRGWPY